MTNTTIEVAKDCCRCGADLPVAQEQKYCTACKQDQEREWRDGLTLKPTKEFPGVDIDAIHYKRGAVKIKDAA